MTTIVYLCQDQNAWPSLVVYSFRGLHDGIYAHHLTIPEKKKIYQ